MSETDTKPVGGCALLRPSGVFNLCVGEVGRVDVNFFQISHFRDSGVDVLEQLEELLDYISRSGKFVYMLRKSLVASFSLRMSRNPHEITLLSHWM